MSNTERHFNRFENAGFKSKFLVENTKTHKTLPKMNIIEIPKEKEI